LRLGPHEKEKKIDLEQLYPEPTQVPLGKSEETKIEKKQEKRRKKR